MPRAASMVMTPDQDQGADSVNAFVDPRLSERLVVTSASTAVDTDQLVAAAVSAADVVAALTQAGVALSSALWNTNVHRKLAPEATATAVMAIQTVCDLVTSVKTRVQQWLDGLSYAALVYAGAEGDARAFNRVWQLTGSGANSIGGGAWEGPGAAAGSWWNTGMLSIHSKAHDVVNTVETLGMLGGGGFLAPPILLNRASRVGSVGLPLALEFTGQKASDAGLLFRAQIDINKASEMFVLKRLLVARPLGIGPEGAQTWWGTSDFGTAPAALEVSWLTDMGLAPLKGSSGAISVVGTVPSDSLSTKTGKPVGWIHTDNRVGSEAQKFSDQAGAAPPRPPQMTATPVTASALLSRIGRLDSTPDHGQFEILRHQTGQKTSWSVVVRGTQVWGTGQRNPQDMLTNIQGVAGAPSDQTAGIKEAMKTVGIKPGDTVEITGHSQGGIVAGQLASDQEIQQKYRVVSVLTAGAPTGNAYVPASTHMLNLESSRDIVPALDGTANLDLGNSATVHFDGGMVKTVAQENSGAGGHDLSGYTALMQWMEQHSAESTQEVTQWSRHRVEQLGLGAETTTTSYLFNTARLGVD